MIGRRMANIIKRFARHRRRVSKARIASLADRLLRVGVVEREIPAFVIFS
jgi:hypothetical protein